MRFLLLVIILISLSSCKLDAVTDSFKKPGAVSAKLEEQTGLDTLITFSMHNGRYKHYTVIVKDNPKDLPHDEIMQAVLAAIASEYETLPDNIYVSYRLN